MLFRRKDKAMAPQTETVVELPKVNDEPVRSGADPSGWVFPAHFSQDDIRDWLLTHPQGDSTPPQVTSLPDPDVPSEQHDDDRDEYEKAYDEVNKLKEENAAVAEGLKANGIVAAAFALPPRLKDEVTSENYNPEEFFLVHQEVWNDLVDATVAEAQLGLENKDLRKQLNAQKRGMRKVNKHWSATKNQLKYALRQRETDAKTVSNVIQDMENLWEADRKRADVFATRLARRLRKARAGRDKRERQVQQLQNQMAQQDYVIQRQHEYIEHLESLLSPVQRRS